ncbi:prepilin peptidase [Micromonospora zingiberis]|uniref:prepilin peptidase n=1 Tax=Micromonospora zingiberis TaxID=2053011 RepID=UPI001F103E07|nr:prepilin peptidase [Micromonospora zingiberis]
MITTAAGTGGVAAIIGAALPVSVTLPAFWIFAVVGVALSIIDVRCRRLPHCLTGALWGSSAAFFIAATVTGGGIGPLVQSAIAGIIATTLMLGLALALPGQLGLGDVLLTGAIAFNLGWLSWQTAGIGLIAGLSLQAVLAVATRRGRAPDPMPLGPALIAGWLVAVVFGS